MALAHRTAGDCEAAAGMYGACRRQPQLDQRIRNAPRESGSAEEDDVHASIWPFRNIRGERPSPHQAACNVSRRHGPRPGSVAPARRGRSGSIPRRGATPVPRLHELGRGRRDRRAVEVQGADDAAHVESSGQVSTGQNGFLGNYCESGFLLACDSVGWRKGRFCRTRINELPKLTQECDNILQSAEFHLQDLHAPRNPRALLLSPPTAPAAPRQPSSDRRIVSASSSAGLAQ